VPIPTPTPEPFAEVLSVSSALAPAVPQGDVAAAVERRFPDAPPRHLAMFANAGITTRRLVREPQWYVAPDTLAERAGLAVVEGTRLATEAAAAALGSAGRVPTDVDAVVVATSTVVRSPGLDVAVAEALGLRSDVRRVPLGSMASLGGANALAVGADLVAAGHRCVLVVVVEVNSLTYVPGDGAPGELATLALFSDGAAAAVLGAPGVGGLLGVVGSHAEVVPDTLGVMGFDLGDDGLRWRLAPDVPDVAARHVRASVDAAAAAVGWDLASVDHLLVHPGGVRVLDAVVGALGVDPVRLAPSLAVLDECGNLSGPTVLVVLERHLAAGPPPGRALLVAMGPGFGFEHVALVPR
jgi:alkylresorcinol/alkylpyrone synthase